jgi:hypothetical protein
VEAVVKKKAAKVSQPKEKKRHVREIYQAHTI